MGEMSSTQLSDWLDYMSVEPFGFDIENLRAGVIASSVFNSQRTNSNDPIVTPSDFFQFDTKQQTNQTDDDIERNFMLFARANNRAQGG